MGVHFDFRRREKRKIVILLLSIAPHLKFENNIIEKSYVTMLHNPYHLKHCERHKGTQVFKINRGPVV